MPPQLQLSPVQLSRLVVSLTATIGTVTALLRRGPRHRVAAARLAAAQALLQLLQVPDRLRTMRPGTWVFDLALRSGWRWELRHCNFEVASLISDNVYSTLARRVCRVYNVFTKIGLDLIREIFD